QPIFASVNAGIFSGALLDALDETRGLIDAHGPAGIVSVSLEIEHEQNAARLNGGATPVRRDNAEEMFRLANRIGGVAEMIGAPEESGARCRRLARPVIGVSIKARIGRFMNHADNAL